LDLWFIISQIILIIIAKKNILDKKANVCYNVVIFKTKIKTKIMATKTSTKISPLIPSRRLQDLAEKIGAPSIRESAMLGTLPNLFEMKPEEILSLFHEGKLSEKDTMFWLGVLAVGAEEKAKKQRELAIVDELTQVYNRRAFIDSLSRELSRLRSKHLHIQKLLTEPMSLTLMMVDIDYFKNVNDKYGHLAGDEVLKGVADILKKQVRGTDTVYRYGGEEFAVLLPNTPRDSALEAAKRINKAVERVRFTINKKTGKKIKVTVSIGLTNVEGTQLANVRVTDMMIPKLISRSDEALYYAKEMGRNQVVLWDKSLKRKLKARKK